MISRNVKNRKTQTDVTCPGCAMDLSERGATGFVKENETYCCEGCAEGTGCSCQEAVIKVKKAGNRPGNIGQRNAENTYRDKNENEKINTSGESKGMSKKSNKKQAAKPIRGDLMRDGSKAPRSQAEERPSTRAQARGRSEFRGKMNKRVNEGGQHIDRVSTTGSKGKG